MYNLLEKNMVAAEKLFDSLLHDKSIHFGYGDKGYSSVPSANLTNTETELKIELFVAGYDKSELTIKTENNHLIISADIKEQKSTADYVEFKKTSFLRKFKLVSDANTNDIKAKHENGVLTVTIPYTIKKTKETSIKID